VPRSRLYLLAAAALAAVIVVVVLIAVLGTGGNGSGTTTTSAEPATTTSGAAPAPAEDPLAGIPQRGATLGRANAPVTIHVFEDPQCPYCRDWNVQTLPDVVQKYVKTGKVKLVYEGIEIIGPNSEAGLRAAYAAGRQNKLWQMANALYERQGQENSGWLDAATIATAAKTAGTDPKQIVSTAPAASVTNELKAAFQLAKRYAVNGTPTFVVERPPALPTQLRLSALDPASFSAALDPLLQ
jgi:protein-disulfide isomerase